MYGWYPHFAGYDNNLQMGSSVKQGDVLVMKLSTCNDISPISLSLGGQVIPAENFTCKTVAYLT